MKVCTILNFIALLGPSFVTADRLVRYLFNSTTAICTAADNTKIQDAIYQVNRRLLRTNPNINRKLPPTDCARACAGQVAGSCYAPGCASYGKRRSLLEYGKDRELLVNMTCSAQVKDIDARLSTLISTNAISEGCKPLLDPNFRTVSCFDDVIYGVVEGITVWNLTVPTAPTVIVHDMPKSGFTICKSTIFSIEARVNPCVDFVHFHMVGPNATIYERDHTEDHIPYSIFGDDDLLNMYGKKLYRTGNYNLTVIPDEILAKKHFIQFKVLSC